MAVVMKQLDRPNEAIEAIKSFRRLCSFESQESLNNVLVELYKRSGRIEEEIEMLHHKLNNIEQGIAFGGKRTKITRSQGKTIQITIEQKALRVLGNLAWAYLRHHDYGLAENFYRRALALEEDNNKKCNLAICLMNMNRFPEAKSLLQSVKASSGSKEMDESYAKSFERALEILTQIDSKSSAQSSVSSNKMEENHHHHPSVLYTQPREGDETRQIRYNKDEDEKVNVHTIRNLDGELLHSTPQKSTDTGGGKKKSWADMAEEEGGDLRPW